MKIKTFFGVVLAVCLIGLSACSDDEHIYDPYANWAQRNATYFKDVMQQARDSIAQSRSRWGDDWEAHCQWRIYGTTSLSDEGSGKTTDSICVEILQRGSGSGCPIYNDSVLVNYRGTLIPTVNALGDTISTVFDHTGLYDDFDDVFNPLFAVPGKLAVSTCVRGVAAALQHMHIGDLWRIYVPQELGYGASAQTNVPAYSLLQFEMQLKAYYRPGTIVPNWQ